eukprot:879676-Rhodomonas_salina.1
MNRVGRRSVRARQSLSGALLLAGCVRRRTDLKRVGQGGWGVRLIELKEDARKENGTDGVEAGRKTPDSARPPVTRTPDAASAFRAGKRAQKRAWEVTGRFEWSTTGKCRSPILDEQKQREQTQTDTNTTTPPSAVELGWLARRGRLPAS